MHACIHHSLVKNNISRWPKSDFCVQTSGLSVRKGLRKSNFFTRVAPDKIKFSQRCLCCPSENKIKKPAPSAASPPPPPDPGGHVRPPLPGSSAASVMLLPPPSCSSHHCWALPLLLSPCSSSTAAVLFLPPLPCSSATPDRGRRPPRISLGGPHHSCHHVPTHAAPHHLDSAATPRSTTACSPPPDIGEGGPPSPLAAFNA